MLAKLLSLHPDVAYLGEPRPIWMRGQAYRSDDTLGRGDLTPRIADFIDRRFAHFLEESGRSRFAEKTPSNCLRIPFIHELYPDCRIVNIIRDGRNVVRSMLHIAKEPPAPRNVSERIRAIPMWEWPAYVPMFFRTIWRTNVLGRRASYWGPRPPGWRDWTKLPSHLAMAHQWRAVVEASIRDGRALPPANYLEVRYEELVGDPDAGLGRVFAHAELRPEREIVEFARGRLDPDRARLRRSLLSEDEERSVLEITGPLLRTLGYLDGASAGSQAQPGAREVV